MNGFLPVMGGNEGKAEVKLGLTVVGKPPVAGIPVANYELNAAEVKFNDAKIPLTLKNFTDFFPPTDLHVSPYGDIVKNTAPDKKIPVRLPGLDAKRLADVTFIPVQFAQVGLRAGAKWGYVKTFGDAPMTYDCVLEEISGDQFKVRVQVKQSFEYLENESYEPVEKQADAIRKVTTSMEGGGVMIFSVKDGAVVSMEMENRTTTDATDLQSNEKTSRKVVSKMIVAREGATVDANFGKVAKPKPIAKDSVFDAWFKQAMAMGRFSLAYLQTQISRLLGMMLGSPRVIRLR